ncbi:MAG: hypothetical protein Q9M36_09560 [Sulfurovum sp.]|nr:hypothetical protein [Sulfurovum sp.]
MSALEKLQAKILQWQKDHNILKDENTKLKVEYESLLKSKENHTKEYTALQEQVHALTAELEEKDEEIEKIIIQVESILE